jgi:hypothetical protein
VMVSDLMSAMTTSSCWRGLLRTKAPDGVATERGRSEVLSWKSFHPGWGESIRQCGEDRTAIVVTAEQSLVHPACRHRSPRRLWRRLFSSQWQCIHYETIRGDLPPLCTRVCISGSRPDQGGFHSVNGPAARSSYNRPAEGHAAFRPHAVSYGRRGRRRRPGVLRDIHGQHRPVAAGHRGRLHPERDGRICWRSTRAGGS